MASKLSDFLQSNKIDPRRILIASRQIERLRPEDRQLRLQKRRGKEASGAAAEGETPAPTKPHSGRPVTTQLLRRAEEGEKISGPAKTRILRAVNRVLEQKKKDPVDLRALF